MKADRQPKLKALAPPAASAMPMAPLPVAAAFKALHAGEASSHQQKLALQWLVREACGKAYFPYHPTDRDTVFALGRLFVGDLVVGLFNADLSSLRRDHGNVETTSSSSQT